MHTTCLTHVFLLHEHSCLNYKIPFCWTTKFLSAELQNSLLLNSKFPSAELQIPFCWTTNSLLLNYKFHSAELQIPFCWTTNSILLNYKFHSAELQIPFFWTTNSILLNYKFPSAELQIPFCWTTNSVFNTNPWLSWILNQYYFPSQTMSSYNSLYSKPMTFQYSNKVITVHYRGLWCGI
jgi:hypothetical protein